VAVVGVGQVERLDQGFVADDEDVADRRGHEVTGALQLPGRQIRARKRHWHPV
jgi:hypothetical protein